MKTEKEREFTFSATFSLQSLSSDLKVPSITNRFSFDSKSYLVYGMKTYYVTLHLRFFSHYSGYLRRWHKNNTG